MKLESLENSKFGAFIGHEINNPLCISGGAEVFVDKTTVTTIDSQGNSTNSTDKFYYGPDSCHDETMPAPGGGVNKGDTVMSSCTPLEREPGFTYTIDVMWGVPEVPCI